MTKSKRHIFFGIMKTFSESTIASHMPDLLISSIGKEYVVLSIMLILRVGS